MKKCLLYSLLVLMASGICGCQSWLDIKPKTSINEEDLFQSESGFEDVLTGFYIKMGGEGLYGSTLTFTFMDRLAQRYEVDAVNDAHKMYDFKENQRGQTDNIYLKMYSLIANVNNFLAYLEKNRPVIETPGYYELMKGEALGLRGFLHFELLRMFGPVYSRNPEAQSIPYRTTFDKVATPRLTAREVTEKLLKDLQEAEELLKDADPQIFDEAPNDEVPNPFLIMRQLRMNIYAVKAVTARVYLYRGGEEDKRLALQYAREVVESEKFELHQTTSGSPILFREHIFALNVYELNKITDVFFNNQSISSMWYTTATTLDKVYEQDGAGDGDFRFYAFKGIDAGSKFVTTKYDQKNYQTDYSGKDLIPLIRLPEMYYIMSECAPDPEESARYLNVVRSQRSIAQEIQVSAEYDRPYEDGYDPDKTFRTNELLKEYMKEFYAEGQLFYFYKRWFYKRFLNCPLEKGMTAENYIFQVPDAELIFGAND